MHIARSSVALAALCALLSPGCAVDAADPDAAVDALLADAPSAGAEDWTIGSVTVNPTWDSGATANLAVRYVKCNVEYGSDYMLTGLDVYEGTGGNFVSGMRGQCRRYDLTDDALPQENSGTKNFFVSPFSSGVMHAIDIPTDAASPDGAYPTGVRLRVHLFGDYVKNFQIQYATKTTSGLAITSSAPQYTAEATSWNGVGVDLSCEDQEVMTGLQLSYDTTNGYIKKLEIFCRILDFT